MRDDGCCLITRYHAVTTYLARKHSISKPSHTPQELMDDYTCPVCNSPKSAFQSDARVVAGFAENQKYGLGFNSVTGSQKLLVIYGALAIGFILLIGGYAME